MNKKISQSKSKISRKENVFKEKTESNDDKFAVLFYASPIAMSLETIGEGKLIDVNQAWLDLVGITDKENVLGKTSVELGLISDAGSRDLLLDELKQDGSVKDAEIIVNDSNGDIIFLHVNLRKVDIGGIKYLFSTNENITEIKLAEEQLRYHAKLVESVSDAIISTDNENVIRSWNRAAESMYGWSAEEVVGKKGSDLLKTEFPKGLSRESLLKELIKVGIWRGQLIQRTRDGRAILVEATTIILKDDFNKSIGGVSIVRDITEQKKMQEALTDAQQLTQNLINHSPAIVYAFDQEERFLLTNTSLADLLNSTPGDMIGKRRHEFMPKDNADWHEANDRKVFKEGKSIEFEEYSQMKDRSITWLTTKFPLLDSQDRIYAVAGISNDISDIKQAQIKTEELLAEIQAEKEKLNTLINNIPDEVWFADLNKNFTLLNSVSRQQFALKKENIGIEEFASSIEVFRPDNSPRPMEENPALLALNGETIKNLEEIVRIPSSGELRNRQVNSSPVKDEKGNIIGSISIVRDITERKQAETKLIEREAQLIELNKTKDKFFNIIAHDLKNPFTSILGASELLYENINGMKPEDIKKLALILNDSAKAGYSILLNLLEWSRSQSGILKISHERINLKDIVAENVKNHQPSANNKGITIINEAVDNIIIITDRNIINTILRNLLSNAIKYTHICGKVVVRLKANTKAITILVNDNGIGISQEKIGALFKLNRSASSPGTENEIGTGLGLNLCKELIEKLGGIISVESEYGKGTTFFFTIPKNNL